MKTRSHTSVIAAGFALFSMFFGAGDLVWPLILGGNVGDKNFFAMIGLLVTGVSLPLLGLLSIMLFEGDYRKFFSRIGYYPCLIVLFIVQAILGPVGSIPRLLTLSYATLKPYFHAEFSLFAFSLLASAFVFAFCIKKQRIVQILGLVLTPLLLMCMALILILGLCHPPEAQMVDLSQSGAFLSGISVGYNTLDLIASFIFAPLVLSHFTEDDDPNPVIAKKNRFKKMLSACLIAAGLLSLMYIGLTYVAAYYTPQLPASIPPEERLSEISSLLLGPYGAFVARLAVALGCLTTAIPLVSISAEYIRTDLLNERWGNVVCMIVTLFLSGSIANLGFMGIAEMLNPLLHILCPFLIILSIVNIYSKLFAKTPCLISGQT